MWDDTQLGKFGFKTSSLYKQLRREAACNAEFYTLAVSASVSRSYCSYVSLSPKAGGDCVVFESGENADFQKSSGYLFARDLRKLEIQHPRVSKSMAPYDFTSEVIT